MPASKMKSYVFFHQKVCDVGLILFCEFISHEYSFPLSIYLKWFVKIDYTLSFILIS